MKKLKERLARFSSAPTLRCQLLVMLHKMHLSAVSCMPSSSVRMPCIVFSVSINARTYRNLVKGEGYEYL